MKLTIEELEHGIKRMKEYLAVIQKHSLGKAEIERVKKTTYRWSRL